MNDFVTDFLFYIFKKVEVIVKKETLMGFLTHPQEERSTLRLVDIVVYKWVGEKITYVDLTGVYSFLVLRTVNFTMRLKALKVASNIEAIQEKIYFDNQYVLI